MTSTSSAAAVHSLRAEALGARAFRPFGDVIAISAQARHITINQGSTERYHDLAALEPGAGGRLIVSLFRGEPRPLPFALSLMERHPLASQAFIPQSGHPWLAVVAPPGPAPTAHALRLFVCRGNQGVNYAPGTWHHPLLALDAVSDFIVLDREGPGENCEVIALDRPALIPALDVQSLLSQ